MRPAQEKLRADLEVIAFRDLAFPLINNWQAKPIHTSVEARQGLFEQVPNPVRWEDSIRYLAQHGVKRFIEVGAGGVLTGLLRNIDPTLQGVRFGEADDLEKLNAATT